MFCPVGFTSVAELWWKYREKRVEGFYISATRYFHSTDFHAIATRGSPLDICEHTFLRSISMFGLCLAAPDGRLIKIHAPLEDGYKSLFSVLDFSTSAYNAAAVKLEEETDDLVLQIAGLAYTSWDGIKIEKSWWREHYPLGAYKYELSSLRFHCLPICFERERYCVVEQLPPWAFRMGNANDLKVIVKHFGGWAICLPDMLNVTEN